MEQRKQHGQVSVGQQVPSKAGTREISALSYRSPEALFGEPWDYSTDVWSWGIVGFQPPHCPPSSNFYQFFQLAQLLLAQMDFKSPGVYDNMAVGALEEKIKAVRDAMAVDFDLHSHPMYAEHPAAHAMLPPPQPEMAYQWAEAMMEKGVAEEDIQFLANTLSPLPGARFTAAEIIESGYLYG